ncbi:pseudaminic acid cytidylyltransferase [Lunatibacter salilacus]|uniref:pseudaminic acid cytidylyltransferase n=1 Tax=Lunatibacter salilacus TaxID=2483804 RepID=UPI00131DCF11|nr:pseudaminic acid cytidylyltransferase [Lunatibacter salilacus]
MSDICIILARGGSKRIPGKNIKDFSGKPIIAYSIEAALSSGVFDEVMVSTDATEIARIAENFGAKVPFFRTDKNADDHATTADAIEEVLLEYCKLGKQFINACCLYPTAPFVSPDSLKEGRRILGESAAETVFPIVKFGYPVWRGLSKDREAAVEMIWKEHLNSRSQDLKEVYHDAGQWYWIDVKRFLKSKKLFTDNSKGVELSPLEVQDIDTLHDWHLAELKYGYLQSLK